jgi:hypothetical protein
MPRPNYRDKGQGASVLKSGGPIGWLQGLWGKRVPGYNSGRGTAVQRQSGGLFGRQTPAYRVPDLDTPGHDQCCIAACGPCPKFGPGTMTPTASDPTTLQGPVTIIVNGQE